MWSMHSHHALTASILLFSTANVVFSSHIPYEAIERERHRREIITPDALADSYDYIIAGGGLAGLVLASRLSEDSDRTVLVLEAGDTGDAVRSQIDPPAGAYFQSLLGTPYDWAFHSTPQANAGGRNISCPRGKILGGSSAVNGMYIVWPSETELGTWQRLSSGGDAGVPGAGSWSWEQFHNALKKSETFTPPVEEVRLGAGIEYNEASHGTDGPMHASYPGFTFDIVGHWLPSLEALGIARNPDPNSGNNVGGFIAQSSINPTNWTRSYSRAAYIDPLPPRPNLHILVNSTVTRILFEDGSQLSEVKATGVEFASSAEGARRTVNVHSDGGEVILAGGAIGSPHMLMTSGVGPRDVLEPAGVQVWLELPGVGEHLQDHMTASLRWNTDAETMGDLKNTGSEFSNSPVFMSFVNSAVAYVNTTMLFGSSPEHAEEFHGVINSFFDSSLETLVQSQYAEVREGYKARYRAIADELVTSSQVGQVEFMLSINAPGVISIQAATQHPFSQGRITISSSSIFDAPLIDPQYLSHPADLTLLRQALKLVRTLGNTPPFANITLDEVVPGPSVVNDTDWDNWVRANAGSEWHPSSTCAMMPREWGGVVGMDLKVHGIANVRVADASVIPIGLSAHLGAPTFALAEQAATIIRAARNGEALPGSDTNNGSIVGGGDGSGARMNAAGVIISLLMMLATVMFAQL